MFLLLNPLGSTPLEEVTLLVHPAQLTIMAGSSSSSTLDLKGGEGNYVLEALSIPGITVAIQSPYTGALFPNETFTAQIVVVTSPDLTNGNYSIQIQALEVSTNRTFDAQLAIHVISPIDLYPENIQWTPPIPASGDSVVFSVSVRNTGDIAVAPKVSFFVDNGPLSNDSNVIYAKQETSYHSQPWLAPHPSGSEQRHNVTVKVDPDNLVAEINENNNNMTGFFYVDSKNYTVTLIPSGLEDRLVNMTIDGVLQGKLTDGIPLVLSFDSTAKENLEVSPCITISSVKRLCTSQSKWLITSNTPGTLAITYSPQFQVTIDSYPSYAPKPIVIPEGFDCTGQTCWYPANQTVYIYLIPRVSPSDWTNVELSDLRVNNVSLGTPNMVPLPINASRVVIANYTRLFRLEISSQYSKVSAQEWIIENSTATWSLDASQIEKSSCDTPWLAPACPALIYTAQNATTGSYYMTRGIPATIIWTYDLVPTLFANLLRAVGLATAVVVVIPPSKLDKKIKRVPLGLLIVCIFLLFYEIWTTWITNGTFLLLLPAAAILGPVAYRVYRKFKRPIALEPKRMI